MIVVFPGLILPGPLGGVDHGGADPVLHAPDGVHRLELREDLRAAGCGQPVEADAGRVADQVEDGVGDEGADSHGFVLLVRERRAPRRPTVTIAPWPNPPSRRRARRSRGCRSRRSTRVRSTSPRLGLPGEFPYLRGIHPTMYLGQAVDDAPVRRVLDGARDERPLPVPPRGGPDGPLDRVRSPDADGIRPRRSARRGRGRQGRRLDRDPRRHARALRRDPARPRLDVDDDQRDRDDPARALRGGRAAAGRARRRRSRARSRTTSSRSTPRAGTYRFPPKPSLRLITDIFEHASEHLPQFNTVSVSGYHIREAGATAPQELAFTIANGLEYVAAAAKRGLAGRPDRAAHLVLLQRPERLLRGDREVPRGAAAVGDAAPGAVQAVRTRAA